MHDYVAGAGSAFLELARRYAKASGHVIPQSVNILGLTPLDFAAEGTAAALKVKLEKWGYSVLSCWAMESGLEEIILAGDAQVNLVVSTTALEAAKELRKCFHTPYVAGIPLHRGFDVLKTALEQAIKTGENQFPCTIRPNGGTEVTLIGEPVTMGSIGAAIGMVHEMSVRVLCPVEADNLLLAPEDRMLRGEEELEEALRGVEIVIADPMYRSICPETTQFYALPHQALSGRSSWNTIRNLITLEI